MQNSLLNTHVTTIDGEVTTLEKYAGKVLLIVNVASRCGLTPQYEQLENIQKAWADQGFVVLGFPCNQFMGQEPGSEEEIKTYCASTWGVTFPMFSKIDVNGDARHPLYQKLIAAAPTAVAPEDRYRARLRTEAVDDALRQQQMQRVNPAVVLRNWLAQRAIDAAEQGDMAELHRLHEVLRQPFTDRDDDYASRPPEWGKRLEVSCSS
ncbi:hypothetical protein CWG17_02875 [Salmonella enterica]|nr:hypothetical protein [Salmonella enterica]